MNSIYNMHFFLFVFLPVFSKPLGFLQGSLSSTATLADGVGSVGSDLTQFSSDLDKTLQILDLEIDTSLSASADVGATLIDSEISELQIDLDLLNKEINDIEADLAQSYDVCSVLSACTSCVLSSNCLWCTTTSKCLPGDEEGPFGVDCPSWEYQECNFEDCEEYTSCTACTGTAVCGWCENGENCMESGEDCSPTFYYEPGEMCPNAQEIKTRQSPDRGENSEEWEELEQLKAEADEIQALIEELSKDQEEILENAVEGMEIQVSGVGIVCDLDDLAQDVDDLWENEVEEGREFQEGLAESARDEVISSVTEESNESTEILIEDIGEEYSEVEQDFYDLEESISSSLDEVQESMESISVAILQDSTVAVVE